MLSFQSLVMQCGSIGNHARSDYLGGTIVVGSVVRIDGDLWAIDSLNANSANSAIDYLARSAADPCLVQDTRTRGEVSKAAERRAARARCALSIEDEARTESGSTSVGVAVGARSLIGLARLVPPVLLPFLDARFQIHWMGDYCRGGLHLLNAYLWCSEGRSPRNLDLLQGIGQVV